MTQDKAKIKFKVTDAIDLYSEYLKKAEYVGVKKQLEQEIINLRSIKQDTLFEESKIIASTLRSDISTWLGHDLLLKGKAQVQLDGQRALDKIKYVFVEDLLGGESGSFYDDKKRIFNCILALGE
jgi:hypothetical protein